MSEIRRKKRTITTPASQAGGRMTTGGAPGLNVIPEEVARDRALEQDANRLNTMAQQTEGIPDGRAVRTGEEEAAYTLGARIGAQMQAGTAGAEERKPGGITQERIQEAEQLLMKYKAGKASVDRRIINAQQWWKVRNWEQIENERGIEGSTSTKGATAWLWNCIVGKHAEAMDSYPEPVILPRMEEDKDEAKILSDILPVVLSINGFEHEFSKEQWQKFQEGTGAYHVGWDNTKMGGMGDISIRNISLLNLFWEPGIEDIQESENVFYVQLADIRRMEEMYPRLAGKLKNAYLKPAEYRKDDSVSTDGKCVLVDWYYHKWDGNRKVLHYCQFVNREIIRSTENEGMAEGLYDHGEYPFVLDALYPVHGSPAGYGLIDIGKDAQGDIDALNQAMVLNAVASSTPRWFIQSDGPINETEYADFRNPFVHISGSVDDRNLRQIEVKPIPGNSMNMLQHKIEELKFITGNTDVQNGATPSGVTAASAIAALQEYSGRGSKDSTRTTYRAYEQVVNLVIELMRQFFDIPRMFRIMGQNGQEKFVQYSNAKIADQQIGGGAYRKPVFDIDVQSQRESAYSKISQNELAIQLNGLGVFNPQMADQSLMMLDMMDFRGKEEVMDKVQQQGTLLEVVMKIGQIAMALGEKFQPEIVPQLAMIMQGVGMDAGGVPPQALQTPQAGGLTEEAPDKPSNESANVRNARARAEASTRPD